ncbi:hypothetical protein BKA62DRAFT_735211 [Auriculariales sp. MPI-PUGE-AT-0066]|nr:hypothetical protein BKA62DRAFT_735211 [Auriculariales sp. MPI-PUGE-AT-0066]
MPPLLNNPNPAIRYSAKRATGFVGIRTREDVTFVSVIVQTLYCTGAFRRAIYETRPNSAIAEQSVFLALQRLFYRLQNSQEAVDLSEFISALQWPHVDFAAGHNLLSFKIYLEGLLEGRVPFLTYGEMRQSIRYTNFTTATCSEYSSLRLNVKGLPSLQESFRDYIATHIVDGCQRTVSFLSFPSVLWLQLNRFESSTNATAKINDRFQYPPQIDLREYCSQRTPSTSNVWTYVLTGVIVHSGDPTRGRYYCFFKPDGRTRWLRFDGERVRVADEREVFDDNFGGASAPWPHIGGRRSTANASACVLVYMRESMLDRILRPVESVHVPRHVVYHIEQPIEENERARFLAGERNATVLSDHQITVRVVTADVFAAHDGFDLADIGRDPGVLSLTVFKADALETVRVQIAQQLKIPETQMRLRHIGIRPNGTMRAGTEIASEHDRDSIGNLWTGLKCPTAELWLLLEIVTDPLAAWPPPNCMLVFLKYFDRTTPEPRLRGAGRMYLSPITLLDMLPAAINERMQWHPSTQLRMYREVCPGVIIALDPHTKLGTTLHAQGFAHGEIVCFERELDLEGGDKNSEVSVVEHYRSLQRKREISCGVQEGLEGVPLGSEENPASPP